jgi:hypothetical protein
VPKYNIQSHSLASLAEISKEMGRLKNQLDVLVAILAEDKIESIDVRNNTTLEKSLFGFGKFLDAIREAHHLIKVARGKYMAEAVKPRRR